MNTGIIIPQLFLLLLLLSGCFAAIDRPDPGVFYKREIKIGGGDSFGDGVMVLPAAKIHDLSFISNGKMDRFFFTTCHRQEMRQVTKDAGLFNNAYTLRLSYSPTPDVEDDGCPIEVAAFEVKLGRHSWGFIDIEDKGTTLNAYLKCNGEVGPVGGVSVCQSKVGLIQQIIFSSPVKAYAAGGDCKAPTSSDGMTFRYQMSLGHCVFGFKEKKFGGRVHRHNSIGYEKILIRG